MEDPNTIKLLIEGSENYRNLIITNNELISLGKSNFNLEEYAGTEDNVVLEAGKKLLEVPKWIAGTALKALNTGIHKVNDQLQINFTSNSSLIKRTAGILSSGKIKEGFQISDADLSNLTSTGRIKDLEDDLESILKTSDVLKKYTIELNGYLEKSLTIVKKLNSVKNDRDVLNVYDEYAAMQYPILTLANKVSDSIFVSDVLPGGKVIKFTHDDRNKKYEYSMSGDKPSGVSGDLGLGPDELKGLVNKLNPINDVHKTLIDSNAKYLKFSGNWSSAVKSVFSNIDNLGDLSGTVKNDIERMLSGNANCLAFYSGFSPRVSTYIDKYIHDLLVLTNKVI